MNEHQIALAKAAKAAGVKLFLPSEFGFDHSNALYVRASVMQLLTELQVAESHLRRKAKSAPSGGGLGLTVHVYYSWSFL